MNILLIKRYIKRILRHITINLGKIIYLFRVSNLAKQLQIEQNKSAVFFGYYDISPFNKENDKVLLNIYNGDQNKTPTKNDYIDIGYYDLNTGNISVINKTNTWCWQQGCRLQFYPHNSNQYVIFNKLIKDEYGSVIYDILEDKTIKENNYPIYTIDSKGKFALSLNFSRLQRLRPGYGYSTLPDNTKDFKVPKDEGVWLIDLEKNTSKLLIHLQELAKIAPEDSMKEAHHYINHILFSPDDKRFIFFHLWVNGINRYSRTFVYSFEKKDFRLLDSDSLASSHYTFKNRNELLMTLIDKKLGLTYKLYDLEANTTKIINNSFLIGDSHPSFITEKKLLFDSYPNNFGLTKLKILNFEESNCIQLDENYHSTLFTGEYRCDLHPRLNFDKTMVCIDTVKKGKRIMKIIDLKE